MIKKKKKISTQDFPGLSATEVKLDFHGKKKDPNYFPPTQELIQGCILSYLPALMGSKVMGSEVAAPSSFTAFTYISILEKKTNPDRGMI